MRSLFIKKDKIYFFIVFAIIYCSHDTLLFGTNSDALFIKLRKIIPFILDVILILINFKVAKCNSSKISFHKIVAIVLILLLPIVSCVCHNEAFDNYIYRLAIMLCALLLSLSEKREKICRYYCSIMAFMSVWSLFVFVIANLFPRLLSFFPTIINSGGLCFSNAIFSVATKSYLYGASRNHCIFREPGVFVVFITIAFIMELLYGDPKSKTKHLFIFTLTMISTMSTAGYIILAAILLYMLLFNKEIKHKTLIIGVIMIAFTIITTMTNLLKSDGAMFNKFTLGSNSYGSWYARSSSLTENLKLAINNPIIGVGRYALYNTVLAQNGAYAAIDNTNTIFIGFASYGCIFGVLLILGCCGFVRYKEKICIYDLFLLLILFMSFSNEDMGQNIIFYYIVFEGLFKLIDYSENKKKMKDVIFI